jgi:hypothetical protein
MPDHVRRRHGTDVRGSSAVAHSVLPEGRFGRIFRKLEPCPLYGPARLSQLADTMRETGATPTGWGSASPPTEGDNEHIPAGYTYFGQFADHDITFDPASSVQRQNDPDALVNFRTPRFDLDSVYGSGPLDEPFQYQADGVRLLTTANSQGFDELPRNSDGVAIIGDPRNDENTVVSQMHLGLIQLHNRFVEEVQQEGMLTDRHHVFAEAQRRTRWHYQWALVHDFLPLLIGRPLFDRLYDVDKTGWPEIRPRYYRPRTSAYMPVEFSAAAYRFGHSQVRDRYALNAEIEVPLFAPGDASGPLTDLRGGQQVPTSWQVSWPFFFRSGDQAPQLSRLINTTLSQSLFDLPARPTDEPQSLPLLNLMKGEQLGLPSGQDVAKHMGESPLTPDELRGPAGVDVPVPTPLWYYLLREAESRGEGGTHLGPVAGRIVGEVLLGLLEQDPTSYYNVERRWEPTLPQGTDLRVLDLLAATPETA